MSNIVKSPSDSLIRGGAIFRKSHFLYGKQIQAIKTAYAPIPHLL